ncbi:MAG: response regulator transcription factor, partial [Verrucomicrobiota bacterium]
MKVLIAEDDPNTREGLCEILRGEGYHVIAAPNGREAWESFQEHQPDVVCLDVMMPEMDGYEVCRKIRSQSDEPAILFITAKSEEIDAVLGLELGADDFIQKPFGVKEVVARIRAVTRRIFKSRKQQESSVKQADFTMADLTVVEDELRGFRGGEAIELSLRDIQILKLLYRNQGRALSRDAF